MPLPLGHPYFTVAKDDQQRMNDFYALSESGGVWGEDLLKVTGRMIVVD